MTIEMRDDGNFQLQLVPLDSKGLHQTTRVFRTSRRSAGAGAGDGERQLKPIAQVLSVTDSVVAVPSPHRSGRY